MSPKVTFTLRGNKWYAIRESKVIAASSDLSELEKIAFGEPMGGHSMGGPTEMPPSPEGQMPPAAPGTGLHEGCPQCGSPDFMEYCPDCGFGLDHAAPGPDPMAGLGGPGQPVEPGMPSHGASVTTPNGLRGRVLGKVASVWGEEVTVRFENGRIVTLPASSVSVEKTLKTAGTTSPIVGLQSRLASTVDGGRESLVGRSAELELIKRQAAALISEGVSHTDARTLDQLVVTADVELAEVSDAISHLDDEETQAYAPPAPFSMGVADDAAASMGGKDGSWLDEVTNDLIAEAEATDFKQLMDEGPEAFTAEMEDSALADAGVVRQMASSFIRSKTAGADPSIRDPYEQTFITRVEQCRRTELAGRKQITKKEAAAEEDRYKDAPDEAIWL